MPSFDPVLVSGCGGRGWRVYAPNEARACSLERTTPNTTALPSLLLVKNTTFTMSSFAAPGQQRYLRACMVCSIVMTYSVRTLPFLTRCPIDPSLTDLALPRRRMPQLRRIPPPRRLARPDRKLYIPGLRGPHHASQPGQVVDRKVAAPRWLRERRVCDQGLGTAA